MKLNQTRKVWISHEAMSLFSGFFYAQSILQTGDLYMNNTKKLIWGAFFVALGLILPFFTGQIPEIGNKLLPMHIPVLICGFVCGWKYGLLVGFITPLFRSMLFGMPPLLTALGMAFELAAYGAVTGALYNRLSKSKWRIYISLFAAMIIGRIVWGIVSVVIYGVSGADFTWQIFLASSLLNAIPGIILQIVVVPMLMLAFEKTGVVNINEEYHTRTC